MLSLGVKVERVAPLLDDLAKELRSQLDYNNDHHHRVVEKGLRLYGQRLVYHVKVGMQYIEGTVQDAMPVQTEIHLIHPFVMNCSCPSQGICRHQMALFFHVYSQVRSVKKWSDDWKLESKRSVEKLFESLRGKANDLLEKKEEDAMPKSTMEQWLSRFETMFEDLASNNGLSNPYLLDLEAKQLYRRLEQFTPSEREWIPLYQVVSALFLYQNLQKLVVSLEHDEMGTNHPLKRFMIQLSDDIIMNVSRLGAIALPFAFDEILSYIRQASHDLVEPQEFLPMISFDIYQKLWTDLFTKSEWRLSEDRRLSFIEEKTFLQTAAHVTIKISRKLDSEARSLVKELGHDSLLFVPTWIEAFDQSMERIIPFVKVIIPFIPEHLATIDNYYEESMFARSIITSIDRFLLREADFVVYDELLYELMPYSERAISNSFIERKQYRRWTEFLMSHGWNAYELHPDEVKLVEKADPTAVLPIFHRTIQSLIQQKNRQSYRDAVRLLKRTKKAYKALQKPETFDHYFSLLMEEHKRLRAFQEECRKGKLLHA